MGRPTWIDSGLDAAFLKGDLETLRRELGSLEGFPNVIAHPAIGPCLTYAIYHSPIEMVAALLDSGADPNAPPNDGFPPLIAALTCADQLREQPFAPMFPNSSSCCSHTARMWVSGASTTTPRFISRPPGVTPTW